jgi:DNA-binding MarR family transcriptional regulator
MPEFDLAADPPQPRVVTALAKIGLALRTQAWREAETRGLTPTQGQILALLRAHDGMRLGAIAEALAVTPQTASNAVTALVAKQLVRKRARADDARALALTLTPAGVRVADEAARWPDFLLAAIATLDAQEQAAFLTGLMKVVRTLQERGQIPVSRMCLTCRFFRPHVHDDAQRPHHCAFVDAPFGPRALRFDCADHAPAEKKAADAAWRKFAPTPA